jgi:hypothetical protein
VRTRRLAAAVLLACAGCGDDGKVGSTEPPRIATPPPRPDPAGPPPSEPPPRPTPPPRAEGDAPASAGVAASWAGTRPGDWATWKLVVPDGGGAVTRVTWRAMKVEAGRVSFTVESTTKDARGTVLSATRTEEVHDLAAEASSPTPVDVRVGEVAVPTTVRVVGTSQGDVQTWTSPSVPFTGLVRSIGAGVDQSLEAFGRGR